MPPDVVRPVASTTVGCLVTLINRMGMIWSAVDLDEGRLRATGHDRAFSTSMVRGMGLVVEYSREGFSRVVSSDEVLRVPSKAADKV